MQSNLSQLASNIRCQSGSLARVLSHQFGPGRRAMEDAATLLRSSRRVLIGGIGASMFAAIALEYFLCAQGIDACVVEAAELLHYRHSACPGATVVLVSRSGESVEVAKLLSLLKERHKVIGICNEPDSLLAREANITLSVGSLADEMVAIQTYTGTLLCGYLLGSAVQRKLSAAGREIEGLIPDFTQLIAVNLERMREWDEFLAEAATIHLLARGPSCASAMEGALLFNEIAKLPASGLPVASFRHGPVELVDEAFRGIVFAQTGRTQELNLALAADLVRFGGKVRVIGPPQDHSAGLEFCPIPAVPEALSPLFEIVPVQVAALRMAELRGIVPGSFRYAPQVARDEARFIFK